MLDWVFEGIVSWLGKNVNSLLDTVSGVMLDALGVDMTVMKAYFPFLDTAFATIRYIAWALLLLMVVWQLFRSFAGPILEAESPWSVLARGTLSAFCIGYSMNIMDIFIYIAKAPYEVISGIPGSTFTFTDTYNYLSTALQTLATGVAMSTTILPLLMIILILALGWNYIKLLLEVVERYILVGVLYFTAPLSFSMIGSKATSNVFKAWCRMTGSELLLLILNVWFVRGFNSGVAVLMTTGGAVSGRTATGAILCIFCLLAYLKVAQKFDSYLATIGLNTAQTGGHLGMELMMMTRAVGGAVGRGFSHGSGSGASASGSTGGTAAQSMSLSSRVKAAFNPDTYRQNAISSNPNQGIKGLNGWALNSIASQSVRNGHATTASTVSKIANGTIQPKGGEFNGLSADNSLPAYMPSFSGKKLSGTSISNGMISTTVSNGDGTTAKYTAYSADSFDKPDGAHRTIKAADGSSWYMTTDAANSSQYYATPSFDGSESADAVQEFFPGSGISSLQSVGDGEMKAEYSDGSEGMLYSSAMFNEPEGAHSTITDSEGLDWYQMEPAANIDDISSQNVGTEAASVSGMDMSADGAYFGNQPDGFSDTENTIPSVSDNSNENSSILTDNSMQTDSVPIQQFNADTPAEGQVSDISTAGAAIPAADVVAAEEISQTTEPSAVITVGEQDSVTRNSTEASVASGSSESVTEGVLNTAEPISVPLTESISNDAEKIGTENSSVTIGNDSIPDAANSSAASPYTDNQHTSVNDAVTDTVSNAESSAVTADTPVQSQLYSQQTNPVPAADSVTDIRQSHSSAASADSAYTDSHTAVDEKAFGNSAVSFSGFMPGYSGDVSEIDTSTKADGYFTVLNKDGTGQRFYDMTQYSPSGNYRVYEDRNGRSWVAYEGHYENVRSVRTDNEGKPVMEKNGKAKERYDTVMKFRQEPKKIKAPEKKAFTETKAPRRRKNR